MNENFKKVVNPGKCYYGGYHSKKPVFCKIEYKDGKLSISGVIAPLRSGNAMGGCGQISMEFKHRNEIDDDARYTNLIPPEHFDFSPGWDGEKWLDFLDVWKQWHLNDMSPCCTHQKALGWDKLAGKEVTLYHFVLKMEVVSEQKKLEKDALEAYRNRMPLHELTPREAHILKLPYEITLSDEIAPEEYEPRKGLSGDYKEVKTLGWLYPKDHPDGILTKECPECGYKYGSAWHTFPVPNDVLEFLLKLPDTTVTPAWV